MNDAKQPQHEWSKAVLSPFCLTCGVKMGVVSVKTSCIDSPTRPLAGEAAQPQKLNVAIVLYQHYLSGINCDHANKTDQAICACSRIQLPVCPSVGSAVQSWIAHVLEEITALAVSTPPAQAFAIFFDDADMETEMFAGEGAESAARQRYSAAKLNWNCHLFARIESSPAALSPAQAAPSDFEKLKKELDGIKDSILIIPGELAKLGDLDDDGGEPEYYANHPLANIVSGIRAHCYGLAISIDELLGRDPMEPAPEPSAQAVAGEPRSVGTGICALCSICHLCTKENEHWTCQKCRCERAPAAPEPVAEPIIDEQFTGMATDEAYKTEALKLAGEKPFLRFERDLNNGAKLHAVFLGDRALHHFRADQNVSAYMADVQRNLDKYVAALSSGKNKESGRASK